MNTSISTWEFLASDAGAALQEEGLRGIVSQTRLPAVAIGGITPDNCAQALAAGAAGVCVISAILAQADIGAAVTAFKTALDAVRRQGL